MWVFVVSSSSSAQLPKAARPWKKHRTSRKISHLLEESLPGKARDEFVEWEGGPTSSSSSQSHQGLWAPATGRPGGAKVLVRRGSARSQAERHGHGPGEPAGADRGRRRRTEAEGPFQRLTGYGRSTGKRNVQESASGDGGRLASFPPSACDGADAARRQLPGAGLGGARCRSISRDAALAARSGAIPRLGAAALPRPPPLSGAGEGAPISREAEPSVRISASSSADVPSPERRQSRPTMDRDGPDAARQEAEVERGRYLSRRAVAQGQLAQIKEHKDQADLAKLEKRREGEQIQRSSQLYQLEVQRDKEKEQEKKVEFQRQHHEYIAEQKIFKAEDKQKEDKDDDRIKAYIKGKEMMADLTREKNAETNRMIEKHKDKAFEQLTAQMNEKFKIEDDRLARGAAEVEVEYQMQNKEKEIKKKAALESIEENRVTVMKLKEEKERQEKEEDEKDRHQWMTENNIYLEMEKAKKQRQRDANMEVQKFQLQQMAEKQARKEQEKQADLACNAQREAAFHQDQAFRR
ncbi:cilia- and flagella- associated protein 210-like [Vidua chalybeata]|uniref:cilia- and flagella- associated protein 210-like n=1 Tax=Vidua chalybeata TaxID=81927 RepID=UPI0023A791F9|nr:cilia- and flagella- associated protein 210-like [Vidua chalybeata]